MSINALQADATDRRRLNEIVRQNSPSVQL